MEQNNCIDDFCNLDIKSESGLEHITSKVTEKDNIELGGQSYFLKDFKVESIMDNKEYVKFIKSSESLIRKSEEYKHYLGFLKNSLNITNCAVLGNITEEDASLEFHHYPFTLFDICEIVLEKYIAEKILLTTFSIAETVLRLHFENKVGLVPLSVTAHELVHAGNLFINLKQVFGNVPEFIKDYKDYIDESKLRKVEELFNRSKIKENNNQSMLEYNTNKKYQNVLEDLDTTKLIPKKELPRFEDEDNYYE